MKRCYTCKEWKSLDSFCKNASKSDGLNGRCKDCNSAYNKVRYQRNRDVALEHNKAYYESHRQERLAVSQQNYQKNKPSHDARVSQYRKSNPEKVKSWYDKYRSNGTASEYNRRTRAKRRNALGSHTSQEFLEKCALRNWRCVYCSTELSKKSVTEDHVIPLIRGGTHYIDNIEPSCLPCNMRKGRKTGQEFMALTRT